MNVLITGGSGYIGSRLVRRLHAEGHAVSLLLPADAPLDQLGGVADRLTIHRDAHRWQGVQRAVREARPDLVYHLAALVLTGHAPEDVRRLVEANVLFGAELLEAMTGAGVGRLVVAGTHWQHYGDAAYDPVNLYAATKQAFEDLLVYWSHTTPLRTVVLKLFEVYGPDDPRPKLVNLLLRLAREGGEADLTPGEQLVDYVHVDDVVEAFAVAGARTAALAPGVRETYAVSSGAPVPLRRLVGEFEAALGRPLGVRWGAKAYRPREVMHPWTGGRPLPGWSARTPLRDGFRRLIGRDP